MTWVAKVRYWEQFEVYRFSCMTPGVTTKLRSRTKLEELGYISH